MNSIGYETATNSLTWPVSCVECFALSSRPCGIRLSAELTGFLEKPVKILRKIAAKSAPVLALLLLAAPGAAYAGDDPTPMFRAKEEKVRGILKDETIAITKKKTMVVGEISRVFDYMELAHRALSRHWDKLTGRQRTEFVGTLQRLIELSVLGKIKPSADYEVEVDPAAV